MLAKLSQTDKDVLALSELHYDSITSMAKILNIATHKVQYSLKKLSDLKIITTRRTWIDVHKLGYSFATINLRPKWSTLQAKRQFVNLIKKYGICTWILETSGEFQFSFSLTFKDITEIYKFYNYLSEIPNFTITRKAINIQRDFEYFGRRYLTKRSFKINSVSLPAQESFLNLNQDDFRILNALSINSSQNIISAMRFSGLSSATFYRRLDSLMKLGIVRGFYAWIDSSTLSRQLYILRITMPGISKDAKVKLWNFAKNHSLVVFIVETVGTWDIEIGIDIDSASDLSSIIDSIINSFPDLLLDIEPIAVTKVHKIRSFPEIEVK